MEWFKHDTDASSDAKIKKLIMRHGAVGYAVYFHCLELIMSDLNKSHITFELEHDAEIIADTLKINGNGTEAGVDIVNKIMSTIIELKLFESSDNRIFCFKLAYRLDSSMTSNTEFRNNIKQLRTTLEHNSHDAVMIPSWSNHDTIMQEEKKKLEEEVRNKKLEEKKKKKETRETNGGQMSRQEKSSLPTPPDFSGKTIPEFEPDPIQRDFDKEWQFSVSHWNDQTVLPEYRKLLCNESNAGEIKNWMTGYNISEVIKAIDNYSELISSIDKKYQYRTFKAFIEKGLDQFHDGAKPHDRYKTTESNKADMGALREIFNSD